MTTAYRGLETATPASGAVALEEESRRLQVSAHTPHAPSLSWGGLTTGKCHDKPTTPSVYTHTQTHILTQTDAYTQAYTDRHAHTHAQSNTSMHTDT